MPGEPDSSSCNSGSSGDSSNNDSGDNNASSICPNGGEPVEVFIDLNGNTETWCIN